MRHDTEAGGRPLKEVLRDAIANAKTHRARWAAVLAEADRIVLCPPDCPRKHPKLEHAHTYGDMLRMEGRARYELELAAARRALDEQQAVDVDAVLRRYGVGDVHRLGLRALDECRPTHRVAAAWWAQPRRQELDALGRQALLLSHPFLAQLGPAGVGKTQAAVWLLAAWARRFPWNQQPGGDEARARTPLLYVRTGDLAGLPLYQQGRGQTLGEWQDEAARARVLLLDELGAEALPGPVVSALQCVLDARYRHGRMTLITSNASPRELEQRLDGDVPAGQAGRLWRRVLEAGWVATHGARGGQLLVGGKPSQWPGAATRK